MTIRTELTEEDIDRRYRAMAAFQIGHLPTDRRAVDDWLRTVTEETKSLTMENLRPSVTGVRQLIDRDSVVRMYVNEMIRQVPVEHRQGIEDADQLLLHLNAIPTKAPAYDSNKNRRIAFPMSTLFVYMMMTTAGEALFRHREFNEKIRGVLQDWQGFLDSEASKKVLGGWLSRPAWNELKLEDFVTKKGFKSYNEFFHREIKEDRRPLDQGEDVIVSANDGEVYKLAQDVKETDHFWVKGQPYSLKDMFGGSGHEPFLGGTVLQSFLSGADYHRWHAPVTGQVTDCRKINGLLFSDLEASGYDPTAGTYSQGYGASVNNRGLVVIENAKVGKVAVMPIGITEISSVQFDKDKVGVGKTVQKGDQLGWFSYGGSSLCLVFQDKPIDFTDKGNWKIDRGSLLMVRSQIGKLIDR